MLEVFVIFKRKHKPFHKPFRTKQWFALFPVKIGDETRWFQKVKVEQQYLPDDPRSNLLYPLIRRFTHSYQNIRFLELK
jgi:hypothetical protein